MTGQVPGSMYTALLANKVIQDPLYRDNDVKLAWIGHENWTYTRYFEGGIHDYYLGGRWGGGNNG